MTEIIIVFIVMVVIVAIIDLLLDNNLKEKRKELDTMLELERAHMVENDHLDQIKNELDTFTDDDLLIDKNLNKYKLVKKYYKFPLTQFSSYIFDYDNNMCLMFTRGISEESKKRFVDVLNGIKDIKFNPDNRIFTIKGGEIYADKIKVIIVRGWGRLKYVKTDKPEKIQDEFGQWVVDTLNNYKKI